MYVFMDSSAVAKLFLNEKESPQVREALTGGRKLVVSGATLVEVPAALAGAVKGKRITRPAALRFVETFRAQMNRRAVVIQLTPELIHDAADLALAHQLRGYDAVQLASSLVATRVLGPVPFLGFDGDLSRAALAEGLRRWKG